jgi:hypothetical protein
MGFLLFIRSSPGPRSGKALKWFLTPQVIAVGLFRFRSSAAI